MQSIVELKGSQRNKLLASFRMWDTVQETKPTPEPTPTHTPTHTPMRKPASKPKPSLSLTLSPAWPLELIQPLPLLA